jgi:hypothetical protein
MKAMTGGDAVAIDSRRSSPAAADLVPGMTRLSLILSALVLTAVGLVAWNKVGPMINPRISVVAAPDSDCDLRTGACEAAFPGGARVAFEVTPRTLPVVKTLKLLVRAQGIAAHRVEVDFSGVDMNMGLNRVALAEVGPGKFTGTAILPVCVRARMTWEAKVLLYTDAGLLAAPFRFDTYLPGRQPASATAEVGPE